MSTEPEVVRHDDTRPHFPSNLRRVVEIAVGVRRVQIDGRGDDAGREGPDDAGCDAPPAFLPARPTTQADLAALTERVRRRVIRWFRLTCLLDAAPAADMLTWENSGVSVDASVRITLRDRYVLSRHKAANWVGPGRGAFRRGWPPFNQPPELAARLRIHAGSAACHE